MERLFIEQTEFTPEISFDHENNELRITGVSRPEDVGNFYTPAIDWLHQFQSYISGIDSPKPVIVEFFFNYFNSASAKIILQILEIIKEINESGVELSVSWIYEEGDEQVKEDGEELSYALDMPFNYYPR